MAETVVFDPAEEVPGRYEFDITRYVAPQGPEWGDAAIEPYYADGKYGRTPIDYTIPNRIVTIPLIVREEAGLGFDELRSILQSKVALWQQEGGVIRRETAIGPVYADVVDATLKLGGGTAQAVQEVDADAVMTCECIPDWYGPERDLGTASGAGELVRVLEPDRGDHPGRVRVVITDTEGVAQRGCLWSIRCRHYSTDATAASVLEAEDLTPMDAAAIATVSGASGGGSNNAIAHSALGTDWTPVLLTDLDGTGPLTHTGTYRVIARCRTTSAVPPRLRLAWGVGVLTGPDANAPVPLPGSDAFYLVDLGEVRLDPAPIGTHSWQGQIQAVGQSGGENVAIDKVWLFSADEFAGRLRAPTSIQIGLQAYAARDSFNQSSGDLHGKTSPVGGNWVTSGDTGDFQVDNTNHNIFRGTTTDSGVIGRAAVLGSAMTVMAARTDVKFPTALLLGVNQGALLRHVDLNNFVSLTLDANPPGASLRLMVVVGGSAVVDTQIDALPISKDLWYTLQAYIDADGNLLAWWAPRGAALGDAVISFQDDVLATGGTLASGKAGLYSWGGALANGAWDNFAAWAPTPDAVIHPGQSLELRTDGAFRENPDDNCFAPVWTSGDLPRLPSGGMENRKVELLLKATRGDIDSLPDRAADDSFNAQIFYRPSYLYVPHAGPGS